MSNGTEEALDPRTLAMLDHAFRLVRGDFRHTVIVVYLYSSDRDKLVRHITQLGVSHNEFERIEFHKYRSYWDLESLLSNNCRDKKEVFLIDPKVIEDKFQRVLDMYHRFDPKG